MGDPQWSDRSSDRPQWTPSAEPQSWFEKQSPSRTSSAPDPAAGVPGADDRWRRAAADNAPGWRPVSDLTDTAWGLDGAWRDPSARWNVAGTAPDTRTHDTHSGWNSRDQRWDSGTGARPGDAGTGEQRWDFGTGARNGEQRWDSGAGGRNGGQQRDQGGGRDGGEQRWDVGPGARHSEQQWDHGQGRDNGEQRWDSGAGRDRGEQRWDSGGGRDGGGRRWDRTSPGDRADRTGGARRWGATTVLADRASRDDRAWYGGDQLGWDRETDDRAGWDRDPGWDLDPGWDRDPGWAAGQGWLGEPSWGAGRHPDDAAGAAPITAGSPVALLERPEPRPAAPPDQEVPGPERKHSVRHPLRIGLFALVLFGLVAGSVAWLSMDKSVTLSVDGEARAVTTYASTVGGVLDDQKITVGQHDTLAPSRETRISDGAEIVLRRGRLITLTVDGQTRQLWTTATTVQDALDQIGYRQANLWMSSDRSTRLPLDGYQLTLRTPKNVTIVAGGAKRTITTTAATVGAALDQAGIDIGANDKLSPLATAPVRAGMTIRLSRTTTKTTTTEAVIEYETIEKTDPDADPGSRTVQTKGVPGLQQVTTVLTYVDGKLTSSKVTKRVVLKQPVDEVVVLGPPAPSTPPPSTQPAGCADFPTTGGLNWCGLAQCESGLNPDAVNPAGPYYGLYQFDTQTWQANGGTGTPIGKSIAEQTRVAYNLYQARGRAPWPVCGKNL